MTKNGGWVWIQSYLTIVHNSRSSRPHCIVSVNYVISDRQNQDLILNAEQMPQYSRSFSQSTNASSWLEYNEGTSASSSPTRTSNQSRSRRSTTAGLSSVNPPSNSTPHQSHFAPDSSVYVQDSESLLQESRMMHSGVPSHFEYQGDFSSQVTEIGKYSSPTLNSPYQKSIFDLTKD